MKQNETKKQLFFDSKYICRKCDYFTDKKSSYDKHLMTSKHQNETNETNTAIKLQKVAINKDFEDINKDFVCICNKIFKSRTTLWRHKKNCNIETNNDFENVSDKELIKKLLKENQEFKSLILECLNKTQNQIHNTIHNTNSHNKQFNLNFFLNETCKNAMNMTEFVDSLQIENKELEDFGKLGYVKGISNIFIRGLNELDENKRPLHCTDKKREILYIKDNDIWEKENENKEKFKKAIKEIIHKNFKKIPKWKEDNPRSEDITSKKNIEYIHILNQVMSGITCEDEPAINKIIKTVSNEVYLDKLI
jgi:hypothetical protein